MNPMCGDIGLRMGFQRFQFRDDHSRRQFNTTFLQSDFVSFPQDFARRYESVSFSICGNDYQQLTLSRGFSYVPKFVVFMPGGVLNPCHDGSAHHIRLVRIGYRLGCGLGGSRRAPWDEDEHLLSPTPGEGNLMVEVALLQKQVLGVLYMIGVKLGSLIPRHVTIAFEMI